MTVRLGAPYPAMQTYTYLPNPEFGDLEGSRQTVDIKRSINNTVYTYVKSKDLRKRLQLRFTLTRGKALELRAFIVSYYRSKIQLTDHLGQVWLGYITTNPNEFESTGRAVGAPGNELQNIQIEFEGIKQ
jgi:hypothetical protein